MKNIFFLGVKELISLIRDPILIGFIIYAFSVSVYIAATSLPATLHKATIAIVDEDQSELSHRISDAFYPPHFSPPSLIELNELDQRMNSGLDSFSIIIPTKFEQDVISGKRPVIQLNIDATSVSQALAGNEHIHQIVLQEIASFLQKRGLKKPQQTIDVPIRILFNPELKEGWFSGMMELIGNITVLSIVLTGAALIREKEHGTIEHLLVMPVSPFEIMISKMWSMSLVVLVASFFSLEIVIQMLIAMPIEGSLALFMVGVLLDLFATTSLGIFLGTISRSMPQFALIVILILLPMLILSGGLTPRESMPDFIQNIMLLTPNTNFVMLSQSILYKGAGFKVVWPQFLSLFAIGTALFSISLARFRKTLSVPT